MRGCACNKTTHTALPTHNIYNKLKHTTDHMYNASTHDMAANAFSDEHALQIFEHKILMQCMTP